MEVEAQQKCTNCGYQELMPFYTEEGQFFGNWCEHCGSVNSSQGPIVPENQK